MLCIMHGSKKVGGGGCLIVKLIAEVSLESPIANEIIPRPRPIPANRAVENVVSELHMYIIY